jgi:hypothetical protein
MEKEEQLNYCEKHNLHSKHKCKKCTIEKREATMLKRYGVVSALQSASIKEKKNKSCLNKYGVEHTFAHESVKEKIKKTALEKYGVEYILQAKSVRDKGAETMKELYGSEHAIQNPEIKEKRVQTNISRFGVENALQSPEVLQRRKETNLERYGTDEVLKIKELQEQIKNTMIETYGAANPLQCPEIKAKKDKTCEELYGDKDIMHNPEIFEKVVKSAFKRKEYKLPSGKIIMYQGYENIAYNKLLETIGEDDFTNDIKKMPKVIYTLNDKSHRYYPDIYIQSQNKIIEVKSPYTFNKCLEQNKCKMKQCIEDGIKFEFWICDTKQVVKIITQETDPDTIDRFVLEDKNIILTENGEEIDE